MVLFEVDELVKDLEKAELEAENCIATPEIYSQLLAVYLYQNEFVKSSCSELSQIWIVGQRMWQRDWTAVHTALNNEWSEQVANIMLALKENVRERAMSLISEAYSSVNLTVLASMTGLSLDESRQIVLDHGWTIDDTTVLPCKVDKDLPSRDALTEDQLNKLTQFVSFLEN
ncbi:hypothetical protein HCN44_002211 [Aphidius gifuensis]|uniref:CSN8/PSMD8/EIF3K domain-containing protein n=1 Tax=Aphidius gifuensis TaxID=684658 RepID=A0A834Y260_APHGI|nr:hypothetical protein HCN44_002211 [Aphidius gifuensis]